MDMEEQKLVERPLMSEGEFKDYMKKNRVLWEISMKEVFFT